MRRCDGLEVQPLLAENWNPREPGSYFFGPKAKYLRGFYDALVGPDAVQAFGLAFAVHFDGSDWSWLDKHGWAFSTVCAAQSRAAIIPTLSHRHIGFGDLHCREPWTHLWKAVATLPMSLRLRFNGDVSLKIDGQVLQSLAGYEQILFFSVLPGELVEIRLHLDRGEAPDAELLQITPNGGLRLPPWESFLPMATCDASETSGP
jgi:hypothetical protein